MTNEQYRAGDKVTLTAEVVSTANGELTLKHNSGYVYGPWLCDVALVERPEPTRTFELTEKQINNLRYGMGHDVVALYHDMVAKFNDAD